MPFLTEDEGYKYLEEMTAFGANLAALRATVERLGQPGFVALSREELEDIYDQIKEVVEAPNHHVYAGYDTAGSGDGHEQRAMEHIHFYYFAIDCRTSGVTCYTFQGTTSEVNLDKQLLNWTAVARSKLNTNVSGDDPEAVVWSKPSYLVFMLDETSWKLWRRPDNKTPHCIFFSDIPADPSGRRSRKHPNGSFFNAEIRDDLDAEKREYLVVKNHHLRAGKKHRRQRNDAVEDYKFDLFYKVAMNPPLPEGTPAKSLTLIIDPSGRNVGP
jgi:hypothetical protein